MRLTTVILIASLMQVSAAGLAQKVSMSKSNASLKAIIKDLRRQSGYDFVYNDKVLDAAKPVTISVQNVNIEEVLNQIFSEQSLTYTIDSKTVVIKERSFVDRIRQKANDFFRQDSVLYRGRVIDEKGKPLAGANIFLKGASKGSISREDGYFERYGTPKSIMVIRYVGYQTREISLAGRDASKEIVVNMVPGENELGEVSIVSTGYQDIPKERATGSFEVIDNKKLNLIQSPNLLKRLEGNTTDLEFRNPLRATSSSNPKKTGILNSLTIRGQNTLYGNSTSGSRVLVVIDGVPLVDNGSIYTEDEISKLNPAEIESVTLLKDAAAQSVYGSRAANGVIVIKTKQAKFNQPIQVGFSTFFNYKDKTDLFYSKRSPTSSLVKLQQDLYDSQFYDYYLQAPEPTTLPTSVPRVVEILNMRDKGIISASTAAAQLTELGNRDVRNDFTKYVLRNYVDQNYNVSLSSGSDKVAYRFSLGYNKTLNNTVNSGAEQLNLNVNTILRPVKQLNVNISLGYNKTNKNDQSSNSFLNETGTASMMPYERLTDANGNPVSVIKFEGFRQSWVDTVGTYGTSIKRLLDWNYVPLNDIYNSYNKTDATRLTATVNADYKINSFLSAALIYGFTRAITNNSNLDGSNSFYARDLVNRYSQGYAGSSPFTRNIPEGGIYTANLDNLIGNNLRTQLNFNKVWAEKHNLSGIIGAAIESTSSATRSDGYYGYNERYKTYSKTLNFSDLEGVPIFEGYNSAIPTFGQPTFPDNNQRSTKFYANAAYTYDGRYTVSGSVAKDASNLFGADRNKTFKPYWSTGLLWNINNEKFYKVAWLPRLALRGTFGYNGNNNYTYVPWPYINTRNKIGAYDYVTLSGLTNKMLRPEKVGMLNLGMDMGLKGNRFSVTFDYYKKYIKDLIGYNDIDPTTGYTDANYNIADMKATGISLSLNSINIKSTNFEWSSNFYYSNNTTVITKNKVLLRRAGPGLQANDVKLEGTDVNTVYAYRWAGLTNNTGMPQYIVNGKPSTNYVAAVINIPQDSLKAMGSQTPKFFGSLRNSFTYKSFFLSFNTLFKLGYVFRRTNVIQYSSLLFNTGLPYEEYERRWQKPGDEAFTNVPAMHMNATADQIYRYADINVLKGDHIRIQEVNFGYSFKQNIKFLKNLNISGSISHLGIIWKANKQGIDPDILDLPEPRTYSLSLSANF